MGNFTRNITKTYSFDGDSITVVMRRLKRSEALELTPYFREENGEVVMAFKDQIQMSSAVIALFPDVVQALSGLFIDGREVVYKYGDECREFNDFIEQSYFMGVHTKMMADLLEASFIKEDEQKKSEELPADTSKVSTLSTVG